MLNHWDSSETYGNEELDPQNFFLSVYINYLHIHTYVYTGVYIIHIYVCMIVWGLFLEYNMNQNYSPKNLNWNQTSHASSSVRLFRLCSRMKLTIIIIFFSLVLGVSSQRWATFLKEAGQGKGLRLCPGVLYVRLAPSFTWAEATSPLGKCLSR